MTKEKPHQEKWCNSLAHTNWMNLVDFFFGTEGFVGDIALPNVRYELEYELQSRRDEQKQLTAKTGQLLTDWRVDGQQAEAENRADKLLLTLSSGGDNVSSPIQAVKESPRRRRQHAGRKEDRAATSITG